MNICELKNREFGEKKTESKFDSSCCIPIHEEELIQEFSRRKQLGHVHSIRSTNQFEYESLDMNGAISLQGHLVKLLQGVGDLFSPDQAVLSPLIEASIGRLEILQEKFELDGLVRKINSQTLVIIPGGYDGHALDYVFCQGFFAIANRTPKRKFSLEKKTLYAIKLNQKPIEAGEVARLIRLRDVSGENFIEELRNFVNTFKSEEQSEFDRTVIRLIDEIKPQRQKAGNCGWASAKASLRVALALLFVNRKMSRKLLGEGMEKARKISHYISTAMRMSLHADYLLAHPAREKDPLYDEYLVEISKEKLKKHLEKMPVKKLAELEKIFPVEISSGSSAAEASSENRASPF